MSLEGIVCPRVVGERAAAVGGAGKRHARLDIRRVIAADPLVDEVKGESSTLRYHSPLLHQAVDAMFAVLAAWRTVDARLRHALGSSSAHEALHVLGTIPTELRQGLEANEPSPGLSDPTRMRCSRR